MRWLVVAVIAGFFQLIGVAAMADQTDPRLGPLFEQLKAANSDQEIGETEQAIWEIWMDSGDETTDKVLRAGTLAMSMRAFDDALTSFNMVIEARPDFAEGWNKRATLYYLMGEFQKSIADCERVLALEPRHFGALSGLGLLYAALGDDAGAIRWFERALKVHPHLRNTPEMIDRLRQRLHEKEV